jgi:site-specific DNA-cytosine methylase
LDTLVVQMLSSMSAELVEVMRGSMVSMLKNTGGTLRFASMCSGSDLIVPLFKQLMARALQRCEMSCEVVHSFSVERAKTKQAWIRANFLPEVLFGDIADMNHACAKDEISGTEVRIPRVHAVVAGLSCKTLSTLNNSTRLTGNILSDQVGCTGRTFAGLLGYVKRHLPPLVILENVRGLVKGARGRQNIAWLENFAKSLGYVLIYQCFNCVDYGLPQDRLRVWLALLFVGKGQTLASIPTCEHASTLMQSFRVPGNVGFTVDEILLPTESAEFKHWSEKYMTSKAVNRLGHAKLSVPKRHTAWRVPRHGLLKLARRKMARLLSLMAVRRSRVNVACRRSVQPAPIINKIVKTKAATPKSMPKWQTLHALMFSKLGMRWPPSQGPKPANCFTESLGTRSAECLLLDEAKCPRTKFVRRLVVLGQSANRSYGSSGASPCLVPNGLLWERARQSPVWGWEQLCIQGLEDTMCTARRMFSNSLLTDMAGHSR